LKLIVKHFFDACHMLPDSCHLVSKGCRNLHGHTYAVIVEAEGENERAGMIVDFKAIKDVVDQFDHTSILKRGPHTESLFEIVGGNKPFVFLEAEPTAENIAREIKHRINKAFPDLKNLVVKVCEGYKGQERGSWIEV